MPKLDRFLKIAVMNRASDLHFSSDERIRMRIDGDLIAIEEPPVTCEEIEAVFMEILTDVEKEKLSTTKNLDKSYSLPGYGNFRINIFWTRKGVSAVLRTIPQNIPSMEELGLPETIANLAGLGKGLVLVTGPTGSGKSTTLAAMINHINQNCPYHILTAEDPIEFVHQSKRSLINQREIGSNCNSFADALKYALREDPDVILVGEMRDLETIALALTAAETGHLVFGTLHTRGAGASVDRIIDSFPANQQAMIRTMLSESLAAVISQSLLKKADGSGRVAAYEIMVVNHAVSNLIREGKTFQIPSLMQTGRKEGMVLMDQYILDLVNKGIVDAGEAEGYMEEPALLGSRVRRKESVPVVASVKANAHVPVQEIEAEEPTYVGSLKADLEEPESVGFDRRLDEINQEEPKRISTLKQPPTPKPFSQPATPAPFKKPATGGTVPPIPPPFPKKKVG